MSKPGVKQALKIARKQPDYLIEMLQEIEDNEVESKLIIMAKKAYRAEVAKRKNKRVNYNKTNSKENI